MKFKATKKEINAGYAVKILIPYCELQSLLSHKSAVAYTARREGLAADIYDLGDGIAIITGYDPFGNIRPGYEIFRKYEEKAEQIIKNRALNYEQVGNQLEILIDEFIEKVVNDHYK